MIQRGLAVLVQQPEVDPNTVTILGHSEVSMIAPRVAIDNPTKVKNIVLMAATAQNESEILYFQIVNLPLLYAEKVLDHNHDGLLSVSEATKNPVFSSMVGNLTMVLKQNITSGTNVTTITQQLNPQYNTNKDVYISLNNELKPKLVKFFQSFFVVTPGKKCMSIESCPIWLNSHYELEPTLSIIGNVPIAISILMLQGENDTQTPVQQAFLLQQKLTDVGHPDHTLITYPNLGHIFSPSSEWQTAPGSIQPYILADLYAWLESHSGFTRTPPTSISSSNSSSSASSTSK